MVLKCKSYINGRHSKAQDPFSLDACDTLDNLMLPSAGTAG